MGCLGRGDTIGIGACDVGVGSLSIAPALRRLGPKIVPAELVAEVERFIYMKGEVSNSDFPDNYPLDVVTNAMKSYVAAHRELAIEEVFLPTSARIYLQRHTMVKEFNKRFEIWGTQKMPPATKQPAESLIWRTQKMPPAAKQPAESLLDIIASQLGFKAGESFDISVTNAFFHIASYISPHLESVLPTPFPFILFASSSAITSKEFEQLKRLQNQIGLPSRFAVMLVAGSADVTKQEIQAASSGGARENIVVLSARDWINVLGSRATLHDAFMFQIQEQIDLLPYF